MTDSVDLKSFVLVEAEKGADLGLVAEVLSMETYIMRRMKEKRSGQFEEEERVLRYILKTADREDLQLLGEKAHDESNAVAVSLYLLFMALFFSGLMSYPSQHSNEVAKMVRIMSLNIVGAEYQYDRAKLTLFYTANMRVDFRFLVKKLFSIFLTRVWLRKVNTNLTFDPPYYSVVALRTGFINPSLQPNSMVSTKGSIPTFVKKISPRSIASSSSPPHYHQQQLHQQLEQQQQQQQMYDQIGTRMHTPHTYPVQNNSVRVPYTVDFSEEEVMAQYTPQRDEMNVFSILSSVPVHKVPSGGSDDEAKSHDSEYSYF
jgi:hypothetical protein